MRLSKKYEKKLKKRILQTLSSIALVTVTLAICKLAGFSVPLEKINNFADSLSTVINSVVSEKGADIESQLNSATVSDVTYIYTAQDFADFRDNVNSGNNYAGETVYLMNNIDLSSVCSETLGTWVPIGNSTTTFSGTFDGNGNTINGIYINTSVNYQGVFSKLSPTGIVKNLTIKGNITIGPHSGGIVGYNEGYVEKCFNYATVKHFADNWILGGIVGYNKGTISQCANYGNITGYDSIGGITGVNNGTIKECINKAVVTNLGYTSGGIAGINGYWTSWTDAIWHGKGNIYNCYNTGTITGVNWYGGIVGAQGYNQTEATSYIYNSYSINTNSIIGNNTYGTTTNSYTTNVNLKTIGPAYIYDVYGQNNGYPVLKWEVPRYRIVENQKYIKIGESIKLTLEVTGEENSLSNVEWTSSNEDVVTIDNNGNVTGKSIGSSTITFCNLDNGLKAKAIVNVYRNTTGAITVPQVGIGEGYTVVLKENGTVWSTGKNDVGQLGDGTTTSRNTLAQVKIDEKTDLTNIRKISVGYSHSVALTIDGQVYVWGNNTSGQLGQGNTTNSVYASKVKGINGEGYIENIIDVVCGDLMTYLIDEEGNTYGTGYNAWNQIDNTTENKLYPSEVIDMGNAIQVTSGYSNVAVLTSGGETWTRGHNAYGVFGNGTTANVGGLYLIGTDINQINLGGYFGAILKEDGTLWTSGGNGKGQLGLGDTTNRNVYTQVKYQNGNVVKAKTISIGSKNLQFIGTDGKVYVGGYNGYGQLSNGSTTNATYPTIMKDKDGTDITDEILLVAGGNCWYENEPRNLGIIRQDGTVWISGDNTYGQFGNEISTSNNYLTKMGKEDYLIYDDSAIVMSSNETTRINKNRLKFIYNSFNVYEKEKYQINNLRYTSLNEDIATINQNGIITSKDVLEGTARIKIEDLDNGFETYVNVLVNRLQNTDTVTYIYTAQDLADFRDNVNAGDNYAGKTVYLMNDIDLSTVCSSTVGSWISIAAGGKYFEGTFDGNYHTISNLYVNNSAYENLGLFAVTTTNTVIQKLKLDNASINNTYNEIKSWTAAGGIVGVNYGKILNCGVNSGNIKATKTSVNTTSNMWPGTHVGGIAGYNYGTISGCYNKASISSYAPTSKYYNEAYAGGICGWNFSYVENCYNAGSVTGASYGLFVGGIVGSQYSTYNKNGYLKNSYNIGSITGNGANYTYVAGILGRNGNGSDSSNNGLTLSNNYCLNNTTYSYKYYWGSGLYTSTEGKVDVSTLKTYTVRLGNAFVYDVYNKNNAYPVLAWENETPVMSFDKNQAYIKVNEKLQLNIIKDKEIGDLINNNYSSSNFEWTSTNEDVATVDSNGIVTGLTDGYTTIYAYNQQADLYAMAVVNVAKDFATPQIETGNGFSLILKADGTVWTIGNNTKGQLGNGGATNSKAPVQVKVDEDTVLENIVKIAVGSNHSLALSKDGKVYAWGANEYGELGQNNKDSLNYAKLVLNTDGTGFLNNIVDISAQGMRSVALDKNGNSYVWGWGTSGEMANNTTTSSNLPIRNNVEKGIKVELGCGHVGVLTSEGTLWNWGRNDNGQLGINCTGNTSYIMKTAIKITDFSLGSCFSTIKKIDRTLYSVGYNGVGYLGTGNTTSSTTYVKVSLPSLVTGNTKVKYIKDGMSTKTLLLSDGTVWATGFNLKGELGNGTTATSTSFVQAKTKEGNLENVLTIGRNNGNIYGSDTTGWGLNTAVILKNGDIYTTGDNTYGQIGNYSTESKFLYYTKMGQENYLTYEDSAIEMSSNEKQTIDKNKLKYIYRSFNVYGEEKYEINNLRYTSLDENILTVDQSGVITSKDITTGMTKIKVEDLDNGFETYINVLVNKLQNTDKITYIYNEKELSDFRDSVNAGDNYKGKSVYVMQDIDMSNVCSNAVGSWEPIGVSGTYFEGTFDGNYHIISNLYIDSSEYLYSGIFGRTTLNSVVQNIKVDNISVSNTYNEVKSSPCIGAIVGLNYGVISNCGVDSGNIKGTKTSVNTTSNMWPGPRVGGITGSNYGTIFGCYNKASIEAYSPTSKSTNEMFAGGIAGGSYKNIENCYNTGSVTGSSYGVFVGGIVGHVNLWSGQTGYLKNCYNIGTLTGSGPYKYIGGVAGRSGWCSTYYAMPITNSYCTTDSTYSYNYWNGTYYTSTEGRVVAETLKTYTSKLGKAFEDDDYTINNGYPVLWWETPKVELNKKQAYINAGENLQLNVINNSQVENLLGKGYSNSDFIWTSSNEDIATVSNTGLVTGANDGYTTIYAYNQAHNLYGMAVINVEKGLATPMAETGKGFTVILKADGTVWTVGNNDKGQLGDGTNETRKQEIQVKIDENTYLQNIIKISVGTNHVLALTNDGKVYAWGANTFGQLGQNDTESSNYAKIVLGEGGSGTLNNIVDISAGSYGSTAINEFGWVYVWGNGTYGENGNGTTISNLVPIKNVLSTGISVSMGAGHSVVLTQNGRANTYGRNTYGELGIGNTTNSNIVSVVEKEVTEVSSAGYETLIKKIDGSVLGAGLNTSGQLATGTKTNTISFTDVKLPSTVTQDNKVKYIKAGITTSNILLKDGTIYTVGTNTKGELGDRTNTQNSSFVQGLTKDGTLENTIMIGRTSSENESLNTIAVNETGRVYATGSNQYGQLGNDECNEINYFIPMGGVTLKYAEEIKLNVGDTFNLAENDFIYIKSNINVYNEDKIEKSLVENAKMLDSNTATYEVKNDVNSGKYGVITAKNIGNTILVVKQEETETLIYIPVKVVSNNTTVVPDIKLGENFTVTLKADGSVWTFGTNNNGELGVGDRNYKNIPTKVEITEIIEQISVGKGHTVALTSDGKIYTWGLNYKGQLGNGSTVNSDIPVQIEKLEDKIIRVIANRNVSYAISSTGKVYAWGEGYETTPKEISFTDSEGNSLDIVDISNSYALSTEGNVYNLSNKQKISIVEKIKYISESETHTVFLSDNNSAYAIGSNSFGQFGDGTNASNNTDVVAIRNSDLSDILRNIAKIEAGKGYTLVLLSDGKIYTSGINNNYQLGVTDLEETNVMTENPAITKLLNNEKQNIMLMSAGTEHLAIVLTDGNVYAWGAGTDGQLGNGLNETKDEPQKVGKNIIISNTNNLTLSENETFDIDSYISYFNLLQDINGDLSYESKDETVISVDRTTGVAQAKKQGYTTIVVRETRTTNIAVIQVRVLPEGIKIEPQVVTSGSHTITLKVDGSVWSYGSNTNGELGNGTTTYSDEPVEAIFPEGIIIKQVEAGGNFSVALDTEGNIWTWGANDYYQLGNTNGSYITKPTKVEGISNISKISVGSYSVLAIDKNKDVYGWGLNSNGELGIGSYTNKIDKPMKAKYLTDVIDIALGKNHSVVLKSTGEVYVTGLNIYGQLGNNDTSVKKINTFAKVESLSEIGRISATDSGNLAVTVNGKVYTWGLNIYGELGLGDKENKYEPTLVDNIENIVLVSGGKNHSIALDKDGIVYSTGSNKFGQLGNGTNNENVNYTQIDGLDSIIDISAGNTYSAVAKQDGTVWAFGDYNHGDKQLKSKTNSLIPIQVGNDSFGLGITKITIKKSQTKNITADLVYNFNLIYLDKNVTDEIRFESLNEEIAKVNEDGDVLGVREGFTWVKVIEKDGKEHVVYVYVTDNNSEYAPEVTAGENFASLLKSDGSIYTWGHNNNGELGIGSTKTKDIPERTNIIASYKEVQSGEGFTIAIRNDGTIWSYGKNVNGQLGNGTTKNSLNPMQVMGLSDIKQIAVGKEHVVALDEYGILYAWGRNNYGQIAVNTDMVTNPTLINYTEGTVKSIWAGENQTIIINAKGEVYGFGEILNGSLSGIEDVVKVSVGEGYMLMLTTDGHVYEYDGVTTNTINIQNVVDIDVTGNKNIAQTVSEEVYTWERYNEPEKDTTKTQIYTVAAGKNNYYVILADGTVYSKGINEFGQLGNGTRKDSQDFILVGDRTFTIEPENKIMYVNDIEDVATQINVAEFNAFNKKVRKAEEYTWISSEPSIVKVENGNLTALSEGTAIITLTDNVTGSQAQITRVVMPIEQDRLNVISVNDEQAEVSNEYEYTVEVETAENTGTLKITTKDNTDKISIDGGNTWHEAGTLTAQIDIPASENQLEILVETSNGTQITYKLMIKKISTDSKLANITVDGIEAIGTSSNSYEVIIPEDTTVSEVIARANDSKAEISINGTAYIPWKSITSVTYDSSGSNMIPIKVPIVVKAENGTEEEYVLTIYKKLSILQLERLTVNGQDATKTSEGVYSAIIDRDLTTAEITAKAVSELVKVSINNEISQVQTATSKVTISEELTEVQIRLSATVNGTEICKDIILNIYKKAETGNIKFVIVNGVVITQNSNGEYETYLPAINDSATVEVVAENTDDYVQIQDNASEKSSSTVTVLTPDDKNTYTIKIIDDQGKIETYTLIIKKPSIDTTLKEITVSNGEYAVNAQKSKTETNVYEARVKDFDNYTVTAYTTNINAKIGLDGEALNKNVTTKVITKTANYKEVEILVESENGETENYILKIYVMSQDAELDYIEVTPTSADNMSPIRAVLQQDGTYLATLTTGETKIKVKAQAMNVQANVSINSEAYEKYVTTRDLTIDSKETISDVYVQAEDGTTKRYQLKVAGLPDDTTLQKVIVNGKEAKYNEGTNKYEIRLENDEFDIEAIATDSLAKVSLNGETEGIGSSTITVSKLGNITIVKIKLTAQDGVDTEEYILEIKEKSNDTSLASVTVGGKQATKMADGNYNISVTGDTENAEIKAITTDGYAIVNLIDKNNNIITENKDTVTATETITERETSYTIKVVAEDGTEEEHKLTITRLNNNKNIKELSVTMEVTKITTDESTGEETSTTNTETKVLTILEDGSYYLKMPRVDSVDVKAILEDNIASVKIGTSDYALAENTRKINTVEEKTTVIISIQAEDGTIKEYPLILEKQSNDTSIKEINTNDMLKLENNKVYVDEDVLSTELTLVTTNSNAYIKLDTDAGYTLNTITRTIDLSESIKQETDDGTGWPIKVLVKAEDGTEKSHTIMFVKEGNVDIAEVKVDDNVTENVKDIYTAKVNVETQAKVEIATKDKGATIDIIKQTTDSDTGEVLETVVFTGTGTLTVNVDLNENPENYLVRITSHSKSTTKDYKLIIIQKSEDTSVSYIKVDNLNAIKQANETYVSTVSKKEEYPVTIKASDENAKIKIAYGTYTSEFKIGKFEENVPVQEEETLEVLVTVQAENGNEEIYKLYITRISDNTKLEYVKVNGETLTDYNSKTKTYTTIVDNSLIEADVEIKSISSKSNISIGPDSNVGTLNTIVELDGEGTNKLLTVTVNAEDGTEEIFYINIVQLSADVVMEEITVNDVKATKVGTFDYEVAISNETGSAKIVATASEITSMVSIDGNTATVSSDTKILTDINGHTEIEVPIIITAEDGTEQQYNLTIKVLESSTDLEYVKVNSGEILPELDEITYKTFIGNNSTNANVEIKAQSGYATLGITNRADLDISNEENLNGIFKFTVNTPEDVTTIKYTVTSETGNTKDYVIVLTKISTDNTLKEVNVGGTKVEQSDDGNYYIDVEHEGELLVKAITNNEYATVRINYNSEEIHETEGEINVTGTTKVIVTVTSQSGVTKKYNLYIRVLENNTDLDKVIVDSEEVTDYNAGAKKYTAIVEKNKSDYELFLMAVNNNATIELFDGEDLVATGVGSLSDIVNIPTEEEGHTYKIRVSLSEEIYSEYLLDIVRISDNTSLKKVEVNDVVVYPTAENNTIYEVQIPAVADTAKIKVETINKYAKVKIADEEEVSAGSTVNLKLDLTSARITVPVVVTAVDGQTVETFNIILIRGSNDTRIELKVNGDTIESDEQGNYQYNIVDTDTEVVIEGRLLGTGVLGEAGLIDINNTGEYGVVTKTVTLNEDVIKGNRTIVVPISVIAEDGTRRNSNLTITVISTDDSMGTIQVNEPFEGSNIERIPTLNSATNQYETKIKYLTEKVEVVITSNDSNATIEYLDLSGNIKKDENGDEIKSVGTLTIDVDTLSDTTYVYYRIVSESESENTIYTLKIDKMSSNTLIDKVEVNGKKSTKGKDGNYSIVVAGSKEKATVVVTKNDEKQTIYINDVKVETSDITLTGVNTEVKIKVEAEDGTIEEKTLTITKSTSISGKIITENYEGKHSSIVTVYKTNDTNSPKTIVGQADTQEDGSYEIDIYVTGVSLAIDGDANGVADALEEEYDIIVTKDGYLSYTMTNILLTEGKTTDIGTYEIIAGDVVESEQIEIDDLVALNDNYGEIITDVNKETKGIYDLNEDGVVNALDRNILKKNYGKKAETVEWVNPNAVKTMSVMSLSKSVAKQDFIVPMKCSYSITSEYGTRTHPVTGEVKKHTGIDLGGIHHTEILAVADGEVVFAGVQNGFGNCIEIKHVVNGETIYSFYAHLSRIDVQAGQEVAQGEVIGLEGGDPDNDPNPGSSTGHHLHFELRSSSGYGNDVNPRDYIEF